MRQIFLVCDGCASHYNGEIVKKSVELKFILVILRSNATHLIHPLYMAVFKPFKLVLRKCVSDFMFENAITAISKKDAMTIGSKNWREFIEYKTRNFASGFRAEGLWPLSFPSMQRRLELFLRTVVSRIQRRIRLG